MLFLVLKPDGLLPFVCPPAGFVNVAELEQAPPRVPTSDELKANLTTDQGKQMLKRIGMKHKGSGTKDVMLASFIRDWNAIQTRALELGVVRPYSRKGIEKLVGFVINEGIYYTTITSGEVFTIDYLKSLAPSPCTREMAMTLTFVEMKDLLSGFGWGGNAFRNKEEASFYVVEEMEREGAMNEPANVVAESDGEVAESSEESGSENSNEEIDKEQDIDRLLCADAFFGEDDEWDIENVKAKTDTVKIVLYCKNHGEITLRFNPNICFVSNIYSEVKDITGIEEMILTGIHSKKVWECDGNPIAFLPKEDEYQAYLSLKGLMGGGKGIRKADLKKKEAKEKKLSALKALLKEKDKVKTSTEDALLSSVIEEIKTFSVEVDGGKPIQIIIKQLQKLSLESLTFIKQTLEDETESGNNDNKLRLIATKFFGANATKLDEVSKNYKTVADLFPPLLNYAFTKSGLNAKFQMPDFLKVVDAVKNRKIGEESAKAKDISAEMQNLSMNG
eukprot:s2173_g7.t1